MDWNHDGKVDGKDCAMFHEVINKESNNETVSGGGKSGSSHKGFELTQLGGAVLGILAFMVVGFIFMGSEFKTIWNLIEIGFIVFLIAQWLDS